MTGATVRGKVRPARAILAKATVEIREPAGAVRRRNHAERKARQLALAYAIERAIEAGEFRSYGDVARALGVSQPRVSQVMALLMLPAAVQDGMLLGDAGLGIGSWCPPRANLSGGRVRRMVLGSKWADLPGARNR